MPTMSVFKHFPSWMAGTFAALWLANSAQATLLGRDIGGNAVATSAASAVFFYDTDRNITWLRNANAAAGSAFDNGSSNSDGRMGWGNAMAWAADLTVGSFSDWRLPVGQAPATCVFATINCTASELGNALDGSFQVIGTISMGYFQSLPLNYSWTSTEFDATHAYAFDFRSGRQNLSLKESVEFAAEYQALAVRDGDVLTTVTQPNDVPEPGTLLLTVAALLGLGVARRKRGLNQASA